MELYGAKLGIGYERKLVLRDFDISVKKGEITTLIGPNGSGKSTVLKTLTRLIGARSGTVFLDGRDLKEIPSKEFARHVGVLPQQHLAPPSFKVKDLVSYGRVPYQRWHQGNSPEDEAAVEHVMRATGVWELRDKTVYDCSGGEAQRVWIAAVLAQEPEILFLDEPTTFLDISYQYEIMSLVKRLNRERGIGVVMVLHDLGQAMEVSDRVIVIKDGRKYAEGPPEKVITSEMMREVYRVDCDVVSLPDRKKPVLVYREIL